MGRRSVPPFTQCGFPVDGVVCGAAATYELVDDCCDGAENIAICEPHIQPALEALDPNADHNYIPQPTK